MMKRSRQAAFFFTRPEGIGRSRGKAEDTAAWLRAVGSSPQPLLPPPCVPRAPNFFGARMSLEAVEALRRENAALKAELGIDIGAEPAMGGSAMTASRAVLRAIGELLPGARRPGAPPRPRPRPRPWPFRRAQIVGAGHALWLSGRGLPCQCAMALLRRAQHGANGRGGAREVTGPGAQGDLPPNGREGAVCRAGTAPGARGRPLRMPWHRSHTRALTPTRRNPWRTRRWST